jgi:hypothetical protein
MHDSFTQDTPGSLPVIFIFAHGNEKDEFHKEPSYLTFHEELDEFAVYAKRNGEGSICLHDVIRNSNFVFLMCCSGNNILEDYLSEQGNDIPDILYYDCDLVLQLTHAIFVGWLIKIMDSNSIIIRNPYPDEIYRGVRHSVRSILYIVKQCKTHIEFWDKLLEWGCISYYKTEKEQEGQELPVDRNHYAKEKQDFDNFYRIYGHTKNIWMFDEHINRVYKEFQSLTLISKGETAPVKQTHLSDFHVTSEEPHNTQTVYNLLSQLKSMSIVESSM